MKVCKKCSQQLEFFWNYCPNCGVEIDHEDDTYDDDEKF